MLKCLDGDLMVVLYSIVGMTITSHKGVMRLGYLIVILHTRNPGSLTSKAGGQCISAIVGGLVWSLLGITKTRIEGTFDFDAWEVYTSMWVLVSARLSCIQG